MSAQPKKPFIIPVFIPHSGCPHRCVFCDQETITGKRPLIPKAEQIRTHIDRYLQFRGSQRSYSQIAFYGGNFLGLSPTRIRFLLQAVQPFIQSGQVKGIRCSTRPDTITRDRLELIKEFSVQTVELGVQSMDDRVLRNIRRGHRAKETEIAVQRLRAWQYDVGLQMMVGLPGEDEASCLHTGQQVADLLPDFVRIYPTVVLRKSLLAEWYREGAYSPLTLDAAVQQCKELVRIFERKNIPIIRMGLQHTEDLSATSNILAGPYHSAFGELVYSELFFDRAVELITPIEPLPRGVVLTVHPRSVSKMRGPRNINLQKLSEKFGLDSIRVVSDPSLLKHEVRLARDERE